MILIVVYRPPNVLFPVFLKYFNCAVNSLFEPSGLLIVAGDFNLNFAVPSFNLSLFKDVLTTFDLISTISEPTSVSNCSATCKYNFFISSRSTQISSVIDLEISDHYAQFMAIDIARKQTETESSVVVWRNFCKVNIGKFVDCIRLEN